MYIVVCCIELNIGCDKDSVTYIYTNELIQSGSKYGIMAVGDVTQDGKIDKADSEAMMDAIESGENDTHYDLNGDDRVDAADLTYITMNYGGNVEAKVLSRISRCV